MTDNPTPGKHTPGNHRIFLRAAVTGAAVVLVGLLIYALIQYRRGPEPEPVVPYDPATFTATRPRLDVPYVSTEYELVRAMLDQAGTGAEDFVVDLGSGDGRIPIIAARDRGARGLGVDIDPNRIRESQANATAAGVADRVTFRQQDLFATPLGDATVLTLYLLPEINLQLRPRILAQMRPGSRVVSNSFDMGDWRPDERRNVLNTTILSWLIPARVAGRWQLEAAGSPAATLLLRQRYQEVSGTVDGRRLGSGTELRGQRIALDLGGGRRLEGRVEGGRMVGDGWQAARTGDN